MSVIPDVRTYQPVFSVVMSTGEVMRRDKAEFHQMELF
jgi:hypothetical protein